MVYSVIGTGAIGGYYGAMLAHGGHDVHFLLHRDYDFVREHGLRMHSYQGDFHLESVNAYSSTCDMPKSDVVLVCLKSVNNHILKELLPPLLKEDTLVVMIENGIGVEEDILEMIPGCQLAAGLAFICSAKTEPGVINHQCYGSITIAPYNVKDRKPLETLLEDLKESGVEAAEVEYDLARWRKAVWNMPFNGMTVAMNAQTDELLKNPSSRAIIWEMMLEVVGAAQALGVKELDESFAQKMIDMTEVMVPYSPSMKLDCDFKRSMEIHYLYSRPIEKAREAGYEMPYLEMLERQLRFIDERNTRK